MVDFWAVWCGPRTMLSPVVEEIAAEHPEIKVGKINTDENRALAQKFRISAIPALLFFKNGEVAGTSVGVVSKEKIEELIAK